MPFDFLAQRRKGAKFFSALRAEGLFFSLLCKEKKKLGHLARGIFIETY